MHIDGVLDEVSSISREHVNLVYGRFSVCAMPGTPRIGQHTPPKPGQDYRNSRTPVGYGGCFLGDMDAFQPPRDGHEAVSSWRQNERTCGPGTLPSPFPTGQLFVAAASFARALVECPYTVRFMKHGKAANRATRCSSAQAGEAASGSFASLTCDCVIGHLVSSCGINMTVADMTWSRAHEYHTVSMAGLESGPVSRFP